MPLKLVKRSDSALWHIIGTVNGQRIRESTGTPNKKRAEEYRAKRENQAWQESIYGARSVVTFSHAVVAYLEAEKRSETTKFHLSRLLGHFKETRLVDIAQPQLDEAYRHILTEGIEASPATKIRGVLTPLRAVLEFSAIRRWCDRPAFERPKVQKQKSVFLLPEDVINIIDNAAEHLKPLIVFLVGTGVRSSEALELDWQNVDWKGRVAVVWQKQGTERRVNLSSVVMAALESIPRRDGKVFRPVYRGRVGEGYSDNGRTSGGQFKNGWSSACRRAGIPGRERVWVPKGQKTERCHFIPDYTPHDLRHTWATWHYCLHHDLLRLKVEGGWESVSIVERYAKVMPDVYAPEIEAFLKSNFSRFIE